MPLADLSSTGCLPALALLVLLPLAAQANDASPATGEALFARSCRACHQTGITGAPRLGDARAWQPLIKQGQHTITAQAWIGIRKMPPRGDDADATLEEFGRAVAYMARSAGATWQDPTPELLARIEREAQRLAAARARKN
jgi:cytochrome c5